MKREPLTRLAAPFGPGFACRPFVGTRGPTHPTQPHPLPSGASGSAPPLPPPLAALAPSPLYSPRPRPLALLAERGGFRLGFP